MGDPDSSETIAAAWSLVVFWGSSWLRSGLDAPASHPNAARQVLAVLHR
ncbi:hypothetical protein ACWDYH_14880 [Nocardia goodfellowii]